MNRAQRRRLGRSLAVPMDAAGQPIAVTLDELRACRDCARALDGLFTNLGRLLGTPSNDTHTQIQQDLQYLERTLAEAERTLSTLDPAIGEVEGLVLSPETLATAYTIASCWIRTEDLYAAELGPVYPEYPDLISACRSVVPDLTPDSARIRAAATKFARIGDALRGESGMLA